MNNNPNDGSKVGLFLRAPGAVAAMRGALPEDDSPAHVTFLILGDLRAFGGPEVLLDALRAAIVAHPSRCWAVLDRVRVSTNTQGQKVAWQEVCFEDGGFGGNYSPRGWPNLCQMREALVADLRNVRGLPIKDHSPDHWTPHFTRAYLAPDETTYTGEPIWAAWQVSHVEVWGYGAPLCVDLRTGGIEPSRNLAFELVKALNPHRAPGPRVAHRVPSWLGALLMAREGLYKGASHKYLRKIPTGKAGKTGKPLYRYYYTVGGGAGLGHHDEFKVGAAFAVKDAGKAGHFHITEDHGDSVTIKHDESGKSSRVAKDALRSMLHNEHAEALGAARQRALNTVEQARKTGTKKQQARAEEAAKRAGAYVPDATPEAPKGAKLDAETGGNGPNLIISARPDDPVPQGRSFEQEQDVKNKALRLDIPEEHFERFIKPGARGLYTNPLAKNELNTAILDSVRDMLRAGGVPNPDAFKLSFRRVMQGPSGTDTIYRVHVNSAHATDKQIERGTSPLFRVVVRVGEDGRKGDYVGESPGEGPLYSGDSFDLDGQRITPSAQRKAPTKENAPAPEYKLGTVDKINLSRGKGQDGQLTIEGVRGAKAWLARLTGAKHSLYGRERDFLRINGEGTTSMDMSSLAPGVYEYNHFVKHGVSGPKMDRGFFIVHHNGKTRFLMDDEVDKALEDHENKLTKAHAPSITKSLANLYGLAPSRA